VVIGSRYVADGGTVNWTIRRILLSWLANKFAAILLHIPAHDITSGYRLYRRNAVEWIRTEEVKSTGYSFLAEILYRTHRAGARIAVYQRFTWYRLALFWRLAEAQTPRTACGSLGPVGSALILTAASFFLRLRATYLVYLAASILFYLAWGTLEALPRHISVLFPLYLVLALISSRWEWLYEPLLAFSIALLALCTVLFANAYQMT